MNQNKNSLLNIKNIKTILKARIPGQLIIQYTDSCNATCPQCGMRNTESFERSKISEEELYKIIDVAVSQNIQAISFTGGEPFIYRNQLIQLISYASNKGIPFIRTGTNGYMFKEYESSNFEYNIHKLAEDLSKTNLRNFWISIDSADANTHEQMRGLKGVIKGIQKALPIFHEHGIYPAANLGINRNIGGVGKIVMNMTDKEEFYQQFQMSFDAFYKFIIELGFTMTNACYPMSVDETNNAEISAVYGATAINSIITFTKDEKIEIFKALMSTIPRFRSKIRIFTPLTSLYSLIKQYEGNDEYPLPCRGGIDFFFVDASGGNTYPCGYRGNENLGKFYDLDIKSIDVKAFCKSCDWECFRDPSELIGFLYQTVKNPFKFHSVKDREYRKLWVNDIKYYHQCGYFDGRKPLKKSLKEL